METGKEEDEDEDGDCGMTLTVESKGNKGWRSLGKPWESCQQRREEINGIHKTNTEF